MAGPFAPADGPQDELKEEEAKKAAEANEAGEKAAKEAVDKAYGAGGETF